MCVQCVYYDLNIAHYDMLIVICTVHTVVFDLHFNTPFRTNISYSKVRPIFIAQNKCLSLNNPFVNESATISSVAVC